MDKVIGSEVKLKLNVTNIDNHKFDETDFTCKFYTHDIANCVTIDKEQMVRIDRDTYVCIVDSNITGPGILRLDLTMYVPDEDCADGRRTEILRGITDVNIIR